MYLFGIREGEKIAFSDNLFDFPSFRKLYNFLKGKKKLPSGKHSPVFYSLSFLPFLVGGLIDSLNPCSLATIIFFAIFLFFFLHQHKVIIVLSGFFILGIFVTKFFLVFGILDRLLLSEAFFSFNRSLYLMLAIVSFALAIINLRDWWVYKKTSSLDNIVFKFFRNISEIPSQSETQNSSCNQLRGLGNKLVALAKRYPSLEGNKFLSAAGFLFGCLVSFPMSICPEKPYVTAMTFAIQGQEQGFLSVIYLVLYSIFFSLPLIFVLCLYVLLQRSERFVSAVQSRFSLFKIICSALFFSVGFGIFYVFW